MNTRPASGGLPATGRERSPAPYYPVASQQHARQRRQQVLQPPMLTTSLANHQSHAALNSGYSSTPSTSLSSPFSQAQPQSPYSPSPASAGRGTSPMAARLSSSSYGNSYNPQEWGYTGGNYSPHIAQTGYSQSGNVANASQSQSIPPPPPRGAADSLPSPPPPYSPPSQRQPLQAAITSPALSATEVSPIPQVSPPYTGVPSQTAAYAHDSSTHSYQRPAHRPRPLSLITTSDAAQWQSGFLPPPPPGGPGSRSSSRNGVDGRVAGQSAFHQYNSSRDSTPPDTYRQHENYQGDPPLRPPSSKRAASTGALQTTNSSFGQGTSNSQTPPRISWEPGMPLPPPPPGPPPSHRSQSVSGSSDASFRQLPQPVPVNRSRPPPVLGTGLERIPPTPANWVDEDVLQNRSTPPRVALHVDTNLTASGTSATRDEVQVEPSSDSASTSNRASSGSLFRSPAFRDTSTKGIRERRVEARQRRHQLSEDFSVTSSSSNQWADAMTQAAPVDLNLTDEKESSQAHHSMLPKTSPRSARSTASAPVSEEPVSIRSYSSSGLFSDDRSAFSTPRPEPSPEIQVSNAAAQTPPFSPNKKPPSLTAERSPVPPKALPTPPLNSAQEWSSPLPLSVRHSEERPISHILHLPNETIPTPAPLSPRRVAAQQQPSSLDSIVRRDTESAQDAMRRFQAFLEKESSASSDAEALNAFAEYILAESSIRRQMYSAAFNAGSLDVEETRRKLFEPPRRPSVPALRRMDTPSNPTSPTMPDSPGIAPQATRPESGWWKNYRPSLSPIASISISNDEMSSRGRPPSRWWESKSSSEGREPKPQRSKRESKYMGVSQDLRGVQSGYDQPLVETAEEDQPPAAYSQPPAYGPDEYPPEKVGWHEPDSSGFASASMSSAPLHLAPQRMDVSRLITLPPPYPRHHPAVNNSHPDLVLYRTTVRAVSDLSEIRSVRLRHEEHMVQLQQSLKEKVQEARRQFKSNIQQQIAEGSITFAEAAEAEAALSDEENKQEKEAVQQDFDLYQEAVLKPMHAILTDRLRRATDCIDELTSKLKDEAKHKRPDQTQEEGDAEPELLEKLTQLKWLFEAREQLHHEIYEIIGESNEKYRALAIMPYKQSKNEEKLRDTDAFFIKDAMSRRVKYEAEALARLQVFMDVVEFNVKRGVEMHLSAFWDIAPSLEALLHQIPRNLDGFQIQIPAREYEENPSYHQYPLQYLYTLLSHAEKSTYQFIESQINLLCLLHEVKSGLMTANCKVSEAQRIRRGEPEDLVRRETRARQTHEENALTADLKDRVATVEGQWTEALGNQLQGLISRVKDQLILDGGWEAIDQME